MIEIRVGEVALDLFPEVQIAFEESNSMFKSVGELGKTFSYPFKFPTSSTNSEALEFAHVVNVVRNRKSYKCTFYYNGVLFAHGELLLLAKTPEHFEASLQVKSRLSWAYDRKMSELYEVGAVCMPDQGSIRQVALVPRMDLTEPISVSINGIIFTSLGDTPWAKIQNLESQINARSVETKGVLAAAYAPATRLILYKDGDLDSDFTVYFLPNSKGISLGYDVYTDSPDLSEKMYAFANAVNENPDNYDFCYPQIINGGGKSEDTVGTNEIASDVFGVLNHHNGTEYTPSTVVKANAFCAQLRVGKAIEKICKTYGWKLESNWLKTSGKDLCFFNNHSVAQYSYGAPTGKQWLEYYWLYAHKLPDVTLADFLNDLEKRFIYVDFDYANQVLIIEPIKTVLKNANTHLVEHFSEEYSLGQTSFKAFRYEYEINSGLKKIVEEQSPFFSYQGIGTGENTIKSQFAFVPTSGKYVRNSPIERHLFAEKLLFTGLIPEKDRPKLLFLFEKKGNTPTGTFYNDLMNLQWKTAETRSEHDWYDENGYPTYTDVYTGDRGLYATFGKEWDKFIGTTVEVQRTLYLTTAELLSFQKTNIWRVDHANYFVVKYNYVLKNERVDRHEVKAVLRIYNGNSVGSFVSGGNTGGGSGGGTGGGGTDPPPLKRRNLLVEFFKNCLTRNIEVEFYEGCAPMHTITINVGTCE